MIRKLNFIQQFGPRVFSLGGGGFENKSLVFKIADNVLKKGHAVSINLNLYQNPVDTSFQLFKLLNFDTQATAILDITHNEFYRFIDHSPILPIVQIKPFVQFVLENEQDFPNNIVYNIQHRWNYFLSRRMNTAGLLFHHSNQVTVDPFHYQLMDDFGETVQNYNFFIQPSFFLKALEEVKEIEKENKFYISVPILSLSKIRRQVEECKDLDAKNTKFLTVGISESRRFWIHEIAEIKNKIHGNPSLFLNETEISDIIKMSNVKTCFLKI